MAPPRLPLLLLLAVVLLGDGSGRARAALDTGGLSRAAFPKGFVFGTATSAFQVEGMATGGGRGPSIWDPFVHTPGNIAENANADVTTDEYHRYKEDVDLLKSLNFDAYRFSISWSRIFPEGEGTVNKEGVAYYNNLIDYVLKKGLTPYVNLNHYDIPLALQKKYEGFLSPKIVNIFADYAEFCFKTYGDRVKNWFTFNEPRIVAALGFDTGTDPPNRCTKCAAGGNSATEPYTVVHNILLCHATAVARYRNKYQASQKGKIGIVLDFNWYEAVTNSTADQAAAQRHPRNHPVNLSHRSASGKQAAMDRAINRTYEEYTPVVEWSHSADASFAKIIVPGFKREEIRVLVDNHGHLRTRGERHLEGNKWSRFQKDLQLPSDCNVDGIRAKFENEALTITLPKKHPSPQTAPATPAMTMPTPAMPEPRKPSTAPPQKPPAALPEPAKPTVLPPVPSQKFPDRRPSLPRKPDVPAPARAAPPVPAPEPELAAATAKPTEEWVKEEAKKAQEEEKRMEREARGKMGEDRKMVDEMKKPKEADGIMGMPQRGTQTAARRGLLVNVAVAVVVLVGITVYVWNNLSAAAGGGGGHGHGDVGNGSYGDEM